MKLTRLTGALCALFVLVSTSFAAEKKQTIKYGYDSLNRVTNVTYPGGKIVSYTYDAAGNRLSQVVMESSKGKGVVGNSVVQEVTPEQIGRAVLKIQEAVLSHPEPLVKEKLLNWIIGGGVQFAANNLLPEMSVSSEPANGTNQVLLWYNIKFVLTVPDVALDDKQAYLQLVLYHVSVNLDDHFSGRLILGPLIPAKPMSPEKMAENIWDRAWSAVTKKWALAKKLNKLHLVPVIREATKNGETPKTFLEGFYNLQMMGNAATLNPALKPWFTARYRKESAKLK